MRILSTAEDVEYCARFSELWGMFSTVEGLAMVSQFATEVDGIPHSTDDIPPSWKFVESSYCFSCFQTVLISPVKEIGDEITRLEY